MSRFRPSIAGLLAGTALLAVATTALVRPTPLWEHGLYSLTVGSLVIAILASIYRSGRRRAFWVGFATCGWFYFLGMNGPAPISLVGGRFVSHAILDLLYPYTVPAPGGRAALVTAGPGNLPTIHLARGFDDAGEFGVFVAAPPPAIWEHWTTPDRSVGSVYARCPPTFLQIGNDLFCLLVATAGGVMARSLHESRDGPAPAA